MYKHAKVALFLAVLWFGPTTPLPALADSSLKEVLARLDTMERENAELHSLVRVLLRRLDTPHAETARTALPERPTLSAEPARHMPAHFAVPEPRLSHDWSGFYAGASAGWGDLSPGQKVTLASSGFGSAGSGIDFYGICAAGAATAVASVPGSVRLSPDPYGLIGGVQVGYNYQVRQLVLGVEADFSGTHIGAFGSDTRRVTSTPVLPLWSFLPVGYDVTSTMTGEQRVDWLATLRPRFGVMPFDSLLFYATGGLAVGHVAASSTLAQSCSFFSQAPPVVGLARDPVSELAQHPRREWDGLQGLVSNTP